MRLGFEVVDTKLRVRSGEATVTDEHVLPYDAAHLDALAQKVVSVLRRGNRTRALGEDALSELRFLGEELHRALVPPALDAELRRGSGPLLLDLDETLVPVPFELVHDGESFLCRRYGVGRVVRSRVTRRGQERRTLGTPPRALVVAADPRGDLAEVRAEADAIVAALEHEKVRARLMGDLDREQLRRELKDYDLVHFAGHADFLPDDPSQSGWHLQRGKLTAADVAQGLAGGRPMPLVVFSNACESGRTDGFAAGEARRAYGLAGAFLYAGVRHYLGTQWEVIDGHSATFATAFYANLASGQAIGAAVHHARATVVERGGEGSLAWASYVLYGDPADRPLKRTSDGKLALPSPKALAARESAPWKRPSPQTMKRVGNELAARRTPSSTPAPSSTLKTLLAGAVVGLAVTLAVGAYLWTHRAPPPRLAVLPIAISAGASGARVEGCVTTGLVGAAAPLVPTAQLAALARSTDLAATDDSRARSLGTALGARWVLWSRVDGEAAKLRLVDTQSGALLREATLPLADLATSCASETQALARALR